MAKKRKKPVKLAPPAHKVRTGPPLELTEALIQQICASVQLGARISAACLAAGFSRSAYQRWLRVGESVVGKLESDPKAKLTDTEECYLLFVFEYRKALGQLECEATHRFYDLAQGSADAMADFLAKRFSHMWAEKKKLTHEHTGKGGGPIQHQYQEMSDADLEAEIERLDKV